MRNKIVAGNWKMNTSLNEGIQLISKFKESINLEASKTDQIIIFPPFTHLASFHKLLGNSQIELGAQNMYYEENGAFTGEISAEMLLDSGCKYVILGHSERRQYFGENNLLLNKKVKQAIAKELTPIYCCGETLEQREAGNHFEVNKQQITEGLFDLEQDAFNKLIIAYEPVWAIGTGRTASPEQAEEMHHYIRSLIEARYDHDTAQNTSILYGGSVKSTNALELFNCENIDGGLIGGASLKPGEFKEIIDAMS